MSSLINANLCTCLHSVSISSTDADIAAGDIADLSPCHVTGSSPCHASGSSVAVVKPCVSASAQLISAEDDSVDRAWREHVTQVLLTASATHTSDARVLRTFHLFPRLFYVRPM